MRVRPGARKPVARVGAIAARAGAIVALLLVVHAQAPEARAQDPAGAERAGLVVAFGGGAVRTFCIPLDTPGMTGLDLLQRSGLELRLESSAAGTTVCRIEGDGCAQPDPCWCQCASPGGSCLFWSYHTLDAASGTWAQASTGPVDRTLSDGDVDGWAWGEGTADAALEPPRSAFEEICAPTGPPAVTAEPLGGDASATGRALDEAPPAAGGTASGDDEDQGRGNPLALPSILVVLLGLGGAWLWLRRG